MDCFHCRGGGRGISGRHVVKLTEPVRRGRDWAGHEFFSTEQLRRCASTRRSEQLGHPWAIIGELTANLIPIM